MNYVKIKIWVLAFFALVFFSQCNKEIDSIKPKNAIAQTDVSGSDIAALRTGMYSVMEDFVFDYWFDFDIRAANFKGGPGFSTNSDPINMNPSDGDLYNRWTKAYTTLNKVNFLLKTIDASSVPITYNTTKGEALYFRALIYYNLVTRWGGVPILTQQIYDVVPRATEAQVWTQIKADLTLAETLVPPTSTSFYISVPAVQALMARVFLATGDKPNAVAYCDKIIALNRFALASDALSYSAIFSAGGTSREIIFGLANNSPANAHLFYQTVNDIDGSWNFSPTTALFSNLYADKEIATGDKRKQAVFTSNDTRMIKFPNGVTGQQLAPTANANATPIIVSRIAEIYLIKAEAQDDVTTLATYLAARYNNFPTANTLASLSASDYQSFILDERQREFYGEGQRWYDVKRTGRTDLFTTLAGRTHLLYYPIPQTEIDLAGYNQNPGY